jgi:hypothetical protein
MEKLRLGYLTILITLTTALILSMFLVFAENVDSPGFWSSRGDVYFTGYSSTGLGLLGLGDKVTVGTERVQDYFFQDEFKTIGIVVGIVYAGYIIASIIAIIIAFMRVLNPQSGKRMVLFFIAVPYGFFMVFAAFISIIYPMITLEYKYSTQYHFLLIPFTLALVATILIKVYNRPPVFYPMQQIPQAYVYGNTEFQQEQEGNL